MNDYEMKLRDEIATKTMQEFLTKPHNMTKSNIEVLARLSYVVADAMLEARWVDNE